MGEHHWGAKLSMGGKGHPKSMQIDTGGHKQSLQKPCVGKALRETAPEEGLTENIIYLNITIHKKIIFILKKH